MTDEKCPNDVDAEEWRHMRKWWDAFKSRDSARAIHGMATEYLALRRQLAVKADSENALAKLVNELRAEHAKYEGSISLRKMT